MKKSLLTWAINFLTLGFTRMGVVDITNTTGGNASVELYGNSAITSGELSEAELAAVQAAEGLTVRDGDDLIESKVEGDEEDEEQETQEGDQQETSQEDQEEQKENEEGGPLETDEQVQSAVSQAQEAAKEVATKVAEAGLDPVAIINEYTKDGKLSEKTYEDLAKAGYGKATIDSIIRGQEATQQVFYNSLFTEAGGKENFQKIAALAAVNDPAGSKAYNDAVDRGDLATAKALLRAFKSDFNAKRGTANQNLQGKQPAAGKPSNQVQPYADSSEMTKAMTDKRYGRDAQYTKQVEARVAVSKF